MIEPPSAELMETLQQFQLCQPRDLRRCRRFVRRLTHDLPAFDSVWVDALVQIGKLTPFQARVLQSGQPDALGVGPCVLVDELGAAERSTRTFLSRHLTKSKNCVLKVLDVAPEDLEDRRHAIREVIDSTSELNCPNAILPQACLEHDGRLFVVSPYSPGRDLREIVIRRGRLQPSVVSQIARQLITILAEVESNGLSHGDLRIGKVQLTPDGRVHLADFGHASRWNLWTQIHRVTRPERCETTPPELIGTDRLPNSQSDMYSLGCLLWQLLAGRPVHPTGDALSRLAAHQTASISDIREVAPDVSDELAALIDWLVQRQPDERPESFSALKNGWSQGMQSRRAVKRYLEDTGLGASSDATGKRPRSTIRVAAMAAGVLIMSGLAFALAHHGARAEVLNIAARLPLPEWAARTVQEQSQPAVAETESEDVQPSAASDEQTGDFPLPDVRGIVRLGDSVDYSVVELNHEDQIVLRGTGAHPTRIVVTDEPLRLTAPMVVLENIEIVLGKGADGPAAASLSLIRSNRIQLRNCVLSGRDAEARTRPVSLAWKQLAAAEPSELSVENCFFRGDGASIYLAETPNIVRISNCLKEGPGALVNLPAPISTEVSGIHCEHVTVRGADALLRIRVKALNDTGEVGVVANRSVFDILPRGAMFQVVTSDTTRPDRVLVTVSGDGSLSRPETRVVAPLIGGQRSTEEWEQAVRIEGVSASPFRFAGASTGRPDDSVVLDVESLPRMSSSDGDAPQEGPGIVARSMPRSRQTSGTVIGAGPNETSTQ